MDSKEEPNADGHRHNTVTENSDTIAIQKKRARRVSFAEMTSIHFFDRDDEESNETSLKQTANIGDDLSGEFGQSEQLKEFGGDDDDDDNDDEEMEMPRSFLRPIGSPSSGGSTIGSASSNDEDNFFGPVSANFIRPGRLSDSAASDDNHDVTMDSTAFSMHYRSLARSDSGLDKTPTGGQLLFEEKTPTNANTSSMSFTLGKKLIPRSAVPVIEVSGSHSSNDMSLVGETRNKYEYERLSPGLDALLAESRQNLLSVSISDDVIESEASIRKEGEVLPSTDHGDNLVGQSDNVRRERGWINSYDVLHGEVSADRIVLDESNGNLGTFPTGPPPKKVSSSILGAGASNADEYIPNRSPHQLSKDGSVTPLMASTSSSVKRRQIFLTNASPSKHLGVTTPLLEQPGSLMRNESLEHHEAETSIQKSISKLELLEKSAFSNTFSARVDKSTIKSLDFLKSPNIEINLEKNGHISKFSFLEDSIGEKLASVPRSNDRSNVVNMEANRAENLNHIRGENHLEEPLVNKLSGMSPKILNANLGIAASPTKLTWSGKTLMRSLFTTKSSSEDELMTETESLLAEIASGDGGKALLTPPKFVSSPRRTWQKKLPASPYFQSSQSKDLLLQRQFEQFSEVNKGRDSTPERSLAGVNLSTTTANMNHVSTRMNGDLSSSFVEVNCNRNLIGIKENDNGEADNYGGKENFGTIGNSITPAKENTSQVMHPEVPEVGNRVIRDVSMFEDNLHGGELRAISHGSVSPSACRNLDESGYQTNLAELPTASPSRKDLVNRKSPRILSPKPIQLSGLENISASKRNVELLLRDTEHRTAMAIMQRSPKLQKGGNFDQEMLLHPNEVTTVTGHERKKWTDIFSKLSEDMKEFIPGSANVLNSKMIDELQDVLIHLQRSQTYEMLRHGVMPQNTTILNLLQLEKVAETNSLLHQLVFEKAKLQLKNIKREKLLKRLQVSSSRIQESQILGKNIMSQPLEKHAPSVLVGAVGDSSLSANLEKDDEICRGKLTAMIQDSEALDRKILNLKGTFHARCQTKAELSHDDTIALVNEHLMRKASFRSSLADSPVTNVKKEKMKKNIENHVSLSVKNFYLRLLRDLVRPFLQMWVVESVGSVNGQHSVVLNYLDFITQSIKVIIGPASSASTSFKLSETNIMKDFPNMDACTAFAFVFNRENALTFIGAKTLARATQVSSSLLGTLLDVVEEVQLAKIEFQNLTQSSFCSPSAEQLDLMLTFFHFNTGRKVILTLDMSCLKRGIYPSDILPLELTSPNDDQNCSFSGPISAQIRDAIKGVRTGYMRISRLCRCVSQVVQSSTA